MQIGDLTTRSATSIVFNMPSCGVKNSAAFNPHTDWIRAYGDRRSTMCYPGFLSRTAFLSVMHIDAEFLPQAFGSSIIDYLRVWLCCNCT